MRLYFDLIYVTRQGCIWICIYVYVSEQGYSLIYVFATGQGYTVDSRYLEFQGTL